MRIPILSGVWTDAAGDVRVSYPVNYLPIPGSNGVSDGYLRPADGIVSKATGPGMDRGGAFWKSTHYRVMGTRLVSVLSDGSILELATIPGEKRCVFEYSFDALGISNGEHLYYWDGAVLVEVNDPDLGVCVDHEFVDGYFISTDGEFVVVTDLQDRTQVNPLKYGASELDPDPVYALLAPRQELHVVNRHTIEVFDNVGGSFFPFQRIKGAQIMKGAIGTHACCEFLDAIAFVGSGRNESASVYIGANAQALKIATREIDLLLAEYTESQLSSIVLEPRVGLGQELLYLRLPDRTLVYDAVMSKATQAPVWCHLKSGFDDTAYRASGFVWAHGQWWVGDTESSGLGVLTNTVSSHWGQIVPWEFGTAMVYNEGRGGIVHELELVALPGRNALGSDPRISTAYSLDGQSWSQEKSIRAGTVGDSLRRLTWVGQGMLRSYRTQRFSGTSDAHLSVLRLEAQLEPLGY